MAIGIYSEKYNRRFWYAAIPKTGSQSIASILNEYPDRHAKIGSYDDGSDVIRSQHHMPVRAMQNYLFDHKPDFSNHEFFTTIRNPWAYHCSYYLYNKEKISKKLLAIKNGTPATQKNIDRLGDYRPNDEAWVEHLKETYQILMTLKDYLEFVYSQNDYKNYNDDWELYTPRFIRHMHPLSWWIDSLHRNTVTVLPIEDNENIIKFFNRVLDIPIKEIPRINDGGYGKNYKHEYYGVTRDLVMEMEREWIERFNYEY